MDTNEEIIKIQDNKDLNYEKNNNDLNVSLIERINELMDTWELNLNTNKSIDERRIEDSCKWKEDRKRTFFPKVPLGIATVILSGIAMFPQTISGHPYAELLVSNSLFYQLWVSLFSISIAVWVSVFLVEYAGNKTINNLFSTKYYDYVYLRTKDGMNVKNKNMFSKRDIYMYFSYAVEPTIYEELKEVFVELVKPDFPLSRWQLNRMYISEFIEIIVKFSIRVILFIGIILLPAALYLYIGPNSAINFMLFFFTLLTLPRHLHTAYISDEIIENASDLFLKKAIEKKLISRVENANEFEYFDDYYKLTYFDSNSE